jgi:UDP:flavonoid glycosyltransferase YjiC (YdhE family)
MRVQETGHGYRMPRYDWTDAELRATLHACLTDPAMRKRLAATGAHMRAQDGPGKAARLLDGLLAEAAR